MAIAGIVLLVLSCGDGAVEPPPPPAPVATTVTVNPGSAALSALGETARFTAEVRDQNGQVTAAVTVAQVVSAVAVSPAADTLVAFGDTVRLVAEATDANGHAVAAVPELEWSSSDTLVARVDDSGLVTGVDEGTATITATAGSVAGTAAVTVAQVVTAVAVSPAADTLVAFGDTVRLVAAATDANGHAVAAVTEFEWSSSDTLVARVDDSGLVESLAEGEATVTATAAEVTGGSELTVVSALPTTIAAGPDTVRFTALGQTERLSAEVRDQAGRVMAESFVSWSSGDTLVVVVDSAGLVTAIGRGATTVTAVAGDASDAVVVTVTQSAGSVLVSPAEGTVARVDDTGLVEGVAEGTARIMATAGDASGVAEVTVENPDRAALVALYEATDGPNWLDNTNWLTDAPLGEWYGVETDASGRTVRLDLSGHWDSDAREYRHHGLSGALPPELGLLTELELLDLSTNNLTGVLPPELGNLANLRWLVVYLNTLSGPIPPGIGDLANLSSLELGNNALSGAIPPELGNLANLRLLRLGWNTLSGPIPPGIGNLANLSVLDLAGNALAGPIPPGLGNLRNLRNLNLQSNAITGPIPLELGTLAELRSLYLQNNRLTGPVPQTFLQLDRLRSFYIRPNNGLCVPGTSAFVAWLRAIEHRDDESESMCNAADIRALTELYEATGGSAWIDSDGWTGDGVVQDWYGVTADSLGRVTILDLSNNALAGQLPHSLGELAHLTELRISGNRRLSGRLPLSLAHLPLRALHYSGTGLCAPVDASFGDWLSAIPSHEGTGTECAPLSDREILETLYHATDGPNWTDNENWLTAAPLREWYGVVADRRGRVLGLYLGSNALTGRVPAELGSLTSLTSLSLAINALTGPIPPQLGNLTKLRRLRLFFNQLSGPIPPELGGLASLEQLQLGGNSLTGPIPRELGRLANLTSLYLFDNQLTGLIPTELGRLASLESAVLWGNELEGPIPTQFRGLAALELLSLSENALSGPIPRELGRLGNLRLLYLDGNALSGPVPTEFGNLSAVEELHLSNNNLSGSLHPNLGRMSSLRELSLTNNAGMSGPLPTALTALRQLEALQAGGTGLCTPADPHFLAWLERIHKRRISPCTEADPPTAYLTQAVQSRAFPVPLVAGERALLRVFPTARQTTDTSLPAVRARFYVNGRPIHVEEIPAKATPVPTEVNENRLSNSANAEIPGRVVQPGLEMVIEVDPDETLDPDLGVATRIPETGRLAVEVRAMPLFDLTLIPFLWRQNPDSSIVELITAMAANPGNHEMLEATRTLLPVADLAVTAHEPVLSSSNNAFVIRDETKAIRAMEGGTGHYMGMMAGRVTGARGVAFLPGQASFSVPYGGTIAHELGHNLNLQHSPCGRTPGTDSAYPYAGGVIGAWGYDFERGRLESPFTPDLMSYCSARWISDYQFANALRYRLFDESRPTTAASRSLLLWGGVNAEGEPRLEPAFVVDSPPLLPDSAGEHRIAGHTADGIQLFSFSFAMPETADGDGSSSFAFVLPAQSGWAGNMASVTLTGPGGSATLDADSNEPMAIFRNPRTGQVRGILRDPPPETRAAADAMGLAAGRGLEMMFSRGIPGVDAWRR